MEPGVKYYNNNNGKDSSRDETHHFRGLETTPHVSNCKCSERSNTGVFTPSVNNNTPHAVPPAVRMPISERTLNRDTYTYRNFTRLEPVLIKDNLSVAFGLGHGLQGTNYIKPSDGCEFNKYSGAYEYSKSILRKMDLQLISAYFIEHQRLMNHVSENFSLQAPVVTDSNKESNQIEVDDFSILPTFHRSESLRKLLDACVQDVQETFCGADATDPPNSVRPLLTYLELLLALSTLHSLKESSEKILNVMRAVSLKSRRLHDERYAYACSILNLIESGDDTAAQRLFDSKPSCLTLLPSCPENKAFVIELADIMLKNFYSKDESLCNKLQVLSTSYECFFKSMTPEAVISHNISLLWRLKIRLQVGDATLFEQNSIFYFAEKIREYSYSLAYFCFGDLSSNTNPQESMFKSKASNLLYGWSALHYLVESTYWMAYMFAIIGANRESVCMLNSLKKISRKFCLPDRMIQCLQLALHFDKTSGRESSIVLHSKQIDYIRNSTDPFVEKAAENFQKSQESEDEEDFLHSKLSQLQDFSPDRLKLKASRINEFTGSSPSTKRKGDRGQPASDAGFDLYETLVAEWFSHSKSMVEEHVFNASYVMNFLNHSSKVDLSTPTPPPSNLSLHSPDSSGGGLVSLLNNFKTPESVISRTKRLDTSSSAVTNSQPPPLCAPAKKKMDESTPKVSFNAPKRRGRPPKKDPTIAIASAFSGLDSAMQSLSVCGGKMSLLTLGQVMQADNAEPKKTVQNRPEKKRRPRLKGILVEKNVHDESKLISPDAEELDPIEKNPSAPYIPANIRLKTKLNVATVESKLTTYTVRERRETGNIVTTMSQDVHDSLVKSFNQLRWLPPPSLFRPLCHLLGVQSLRDNNQMKAAFYLVQSVFIAFRVNYEHELIKKLKHKSLNNETRASALQVFQACQKDVPSFIETIERTLPVNWLIIQFTLVDELSLIPGENTDSRSHPLLLVTKIQAKSSPETRVIEGFSMKSIEDFENLLVENLQSTSITKANVYWNKRYNLDNEMEKLIQRIRDQWFPKDVLSWLLSSQSSSDPIVLILDRCLSNLPFEWLVSNSSELHITRMPCVAIALAHLHITSLIPTSKSSSSSTTTTDNNRKLVIQNGFYVLNPERNLPSTEKRLVPIFSDPSLNWQGVVGRAPTKDEAIKAMEEHHILMYCGHGSGSRYLFPKVLSVTKSKAVALLFGCSSSRLHIEGVFEPTSSMLTHLIAGSPCILGLLWDVTDGDIDRYSCRLLEAWQNSDNSKFVHLVRESKMACKLQHLIGKSPVIYGYPLEKL